MYVCTSVCTCRAESAFCAGKLRRLPASHFFVRALRESNMRMHNLFVWHKEWPRARERERGGFFVVATKREPMATLALALDADDILLIMHRPADEALKRCDFHHRMQALSSRRQSTTLSSPPPQVRTYRTITGWITTIWCLLLRKTNHWKSFQAHTHTHAECRCRHITVSMLRVFRMHSGFGFGIHRSVCSFSLSLSFRLNIWILLLPLVASFFVTTVEYKHAQPTHLVSSRDVFYATE